MARRDLFDSGLSSSGSLPLAALLLALTFAGCGGLQAVNLDGPNNGTPKVTDSRKHAGRVPVTSAKAAIAAGKKLQAAAGATSIGHSLGGFRSYPIKLSKTGARGRGWRGQKSMASPIAQLMDRAFSARIGLDAVHLDAFADSGASAAQCRAAGKRPCAAICRREPRWTRLDRESYAASKAYFAHNNLAIALTRFADKYAANGKGLYIQLHEPSGCRSAGPDGEHSCHDQIGNVIRRIAAIDGPKKRLGQGLALTSRSRHVLETAQKKAEDLGLKSDRIQYVLIAGDHFAGGSKTDKSCGLVASSAQVLERARRKELAWMAKTPWLNSVWVRPRCFSGAIGELAKVNATRASAKGADGQPSAIPALSVIIATSSWSQAKTHAWITKNLGKGDAMAAPKPRISGLSYQIDED
ncbi:MAG: hypothetical protein KC502_23315 [Myxococcales bacterium]|nr:hypothetical protein [Myxococcales bacterium]